MKIGDKVIPYVEKLVSNTDNSWNLELKIYIINDIKEDHLYFDGKHLGYVKSRFRNITKEWFDELKEIINEV